MKFFKYHGAGNDFILIDNRRGELDYNNSKLISELCHRRFGIGADGVIALENHELTDFKMLYFNANGQKGSLCGNGARCAVAFAKNQGIVSRRAVFTAADGMHEAEIDKRGRVNLKMANVIDVENRNEVEYILDTGSPHFVRFVTNLNELDIEKEGKTIRHSKEFDKEGINVNFVQETAPNVLSIETFERGVEAVTYSCGTGAVAASVSFLLHIKAPNDSYTINLKTKGGSLTVKLDKTRFGFENIWLKGDAEKVFEGKM